MTTFVRVETATFSVQPMLPKVRVLSPEEPGQPSPQPAARTATKSASTKASGFLPNSVNPNLLRALGDPRAEARGRSSDHELAKARRSFVYAEVLGPLCFLGGVDRRLHDVLVVLEPGLGALDRV